jgi:hypothetical protein
MSRGTIFPNTTPGIEVGASWVLDNDKIAAINNGKQWIVIIAQVRYTDRFKKKTYHTHICAFYSVADGGYVYCARGNSAD